MKAVIFFALLALAAAVYIPESSVTPSIEGTWKVIDGEKCKQPNGKAVFDTAYVVSFNVSDYYLFTSVHSGFAGGLTKVQTDGSFQGVSDAFTSVSGKIDVIAGNGTVTVSLGSTKCTASLVKNFMPTLTSTTVSSTSSNTPATTSNPPVVIPNISGIWNVVDGEKCKQPDDKAIFDTAYVVSFNISDYYLFTSVHPGFAGGLAKVQTDGSFQGAGVGEQFSFVSGKIDVAAGTGTVTVSLPNTPKCSAQLVKQKIIVLTSTTSTTEISSSSTTLTTSTTETPATTSSSSATVTTSTNDVKKTTSTLSKSAANSLVAVSLVLFAAVTLF